LLSRVAAAEPHTGRILLTGYADIAATIDAINRGRVHAYVNKPCPPDHLRTVVAMVAGLVAAERRNGALIEELAHRNEELEEIVATLRCDREKAVIDVAEAAARKLELTLAPILSLAQRNAAEEFSSEQAEAGPWRRSAEEFLAAIQQALGEVSEWPSTASPTRLGSNSD
jgi:response regulator RpfG family c-di-GMP phosphodiesterase